MKAEEGFDPPPDQIKHFNKSFIFIFKIEWCLVILHTNFTKSVKVEDNNIELHRAMVL